jgi:predicted XRE-type DNA-binding protein
MLKSSYELLLEQFSLHYPHFYKQSIDWWKSGPYHITFLLSNRDRIEFNASENTIRYIKPIDHFADSPDLRREIGRNIRKFITYRGLRQQEVSESAGITEAMLSRYINGTSMPGLDKLHNLACALGCQLTDLLGQTEE